MNFGICFISPYPELTDLLKQTLARLPEPPQIVEGAMSGAEAVARTVEKQGTEVLVTTEYNARYLRSKVMIPIVTIPLSVFDVARALHRAKVQHGEPVALLEPLDHNPHLAAMKEMLGCEIKQYVFLDEDDGLAKLRQAKRDGYRSVVGGGIIARLAQKTGCPCIRLFPGIEAILHAFHQAEQIADVRRTERYETMKFKSIVQYSFTGIVVTDQNSRIIVFNSAAERMFTIPATQALGRSMEEIIPGGMLSLASDKTQAQLEEVKTIGRKQFMVNTIPILDRGRFEGTIFNFQEVSQIQSLEEKIRRASHDKGLIAKMTFDDVVGVSQIAKEALHRASRFAASDETVLITGETGTGKEVFAQSIHNASRRRARPFVAVSCATISPSLLESELFGYAEGAFTGARRGGRQGFFELAHGGTIFLDEIGELPHETQIYLLRVLQEKELMRVGDSKVIPVDVRVVAATNKRLEEALEQGQLRSDLFHRLNVLRLTLLPLREHPEDILPLAHMVLHRICPDRNLVDKIEAVLLNNGALLHKYPWPGNVREVQNLIRRIVVSVETVGDNSLTTEVELLLHEALGCKQPIQFPGSALLFSDDLKEVLTHVEHELIRQKGMEFEGNKAQLAKKLGIGRSTLWRKMREIH